MAVLSCLLSYHLHQEISKGSVKVPLSPLYLQVEEKTHEVGSDLRGHKGRWGEWSTPSMACSQQPGPPCPVQFPAVTEASEEISKIISGIQSTHWKCPKEKKAVLHRHIRHSWRQHELFVSFNSTPQIWNVGCAGVEGHPEADGQRMPEQRISFAFFLVKEIISNYRQSGASSQRASVLRIDFKIPLSQGNIVPKRHQPPC